MEEMVKEWSMLVAQFFTDFVMAIVSVFTSVLGLVLLLFPVWLVLFVALAVIRHYS